MKRMFLSLVLPVVFSIVVIHGPLAFTSSDSSISPPLKVVVVTGSNYEMGVQYGEQAAELIAANRDVVWNLLDTRVKDGNGNLLNRNAVFKDIHVWTFYLEKYDLKLKAWLLGISQGCRNKGFDVPYQDLVALMVYPQEIWARPQMPYPAETGVVASPTDMKANLLARERVDAKPISSCTAFAAERTAAQGGKPIVSITGGAFLEVKNYVVLIAFPADGERFVTLTNAGRVSNNGGMNSRYAWVMPASVTAPRLPCASSWGVSSEVYFHYLLQYCKSPAEAVKYLDETPKGGVTGLFLFADKSNGVLAYEGGFCGSAVRKPGDLGERGFIVQTNNYNSPNMSPYNLEADHFRDTYVRYATAFKKLSLAPAGTVGLDFAKALWAANDWYDASTNTWHTVPVPNDSSDLNICNVPGNLCEGGEYQIIQFPTQKTAYLQLGNPQGTSIQKYWPDIPRPTGEYTKWQLKDSINEVARAAYGEALAMIKEASNSFSGVEGRESLQRLLMQAKEALHSGRRAEQSARLALRDKKETQIALWSRACTDYATAQLYAQMVSTELKRPIK
jgi:hypothetical protein